MILCEWDASEGHPGQSCVHLYARILSTSFTSFSIFSVWCYSSVSISMLGSYSLPAPYSVQGQKAGSKHFRHSSVQEINWKRPMLFAVVIFCSNPSPCFSRPFSSFFLSLSSLSLPCLCDGRWRESGFGAK